MVKSGKNKTKPKLNLSVREEQRNKLEQMAALERRSVSNLIEVMADERWERLVEQQGTAYAKTVAEAMNLKLDLDNPAEHAKLRRAILSVVAERKGRKHKTARFAVNRSPFATKKNLIPKASRSWAGSRGSKKA